MDDLDALQSNDIKMPFANLEPGVLYKIAHIVATKSVYQGKEIQGIKATLEFGDMKVFTYLPKSFVNMKPSTIDIINNAANKNEHFSLCYYGSIQTQNIGRIHKFGEGVNVKLLNDVAKAATPFKSPIKRGISDTEEVTGPKRHCVSTDLTHPKIEMDKGKEVEDTPSKSEG